MIPFGDNGSTISIMTETEPNYMYTHNVWALAMCLIYAGNSWCVIVSGPEAAATLLRAEGKYPSRGYFEENMMWIYRNINKPYPMFFRYMHAAMRIVPYSSYSYSYISENISKVVKVYSPPSPPPNRSIVQS